MKNFRNALAFIVLTGLLLTFTLASFATVVGTTYQAGTTYCDQQHFGSAGKMIGVDQTGWVHVVWMRDLNSSLTERHAYYNIWNPSTENFLYSGDGGIQIDASQRGGYVSQTTSPEGYCFPAFQQATTGSDEHTAASIDFLPQVGAFTTVEPSYLGSMEIVFPKIAMSGDSTLHVVSTENPVAANTHRRIYYSQGIPQFDEFGFGESIDWQPVGFAGAEFLQIDTTMTIAADIAASKTSGRVAIVYSRSRDNYAYSPTLINNDLYMVVSENGGQDWGTPINITQFIDPAPDCPDGDTLQCCGDTLRVFADASIIFDESDNIHVAFTTLTYFAHGYPNVSGGPFSFVGRSGIWHWSEPASKFSQIASAYYPLTADNGGIVLNPSQGELNVQRPSLSLDPVTGYLYCSYQLHDSTRYSTASIPMADAFVTVSTDGGTHWAVGTNVTDSAPATVPAPPGTSMYERDITIADRVTYTDDVGYIHMEYVLDLDAGNDSPLRTVTENPVYYQRIPVDEIAASPLIPDYPFHISSATSAEFTANDVGLSLCIHLMPDESSFIWVYDVPTGQYPEVTKQLGCSVPCNDPCDPATYIEEFHNGEWQHNAVTNVWWLEIRGDGCICVTLDGILPVELTGFDAIPGNQSVTLRWQTASETDNDHFDIVRNSTTVGRVDANGSSSGSSYEWSENHLTNGTEYTYTVSSVDIWGGVEELFTISATPTFNSTAVTEYALHQNYPNPFNPDTRISFDLAESGFVSLKVYNMLGQQIATLVNTTMESGRHTVTFDASGLPSGLYLYRMEAGDFMSQKKMILLK